MTNTHYYFNDHLGAPILQTDATGAVVWRVERDPYGERYATRVGAERHQPLGLPGQEYDESAPDRQYNIFRWYRAGWGRYTQADPLGLEGGLNLYAYASGQPTVSIDPRGLRTCVIFTRDTLLGKSYYSHTAVVVWGPCKNGGTDCSRPDRFLYDPAGGYKANQRGSGGMFVNDDFSIADYFKYHRDKGSEIEMYCFDTSCCDEQQIYDRADRTGDPRGFSCSTSVSGCIAGVGPFSGLSQTFYPSRCRNQILNDRLRRRQ